MRLLLTLLACLLLTACIINKTSYQNLHNKKSNQLRVVTYNLNSFHNPINKNTIRMIRQINSDVILFQEITPRTDRCLIINLKQRYPYNDFKPYCKTGGLAIFSKYPFHNLHYFLPGGSQYPAWISILQTPFGRLQIVNTHLQPPIDTDKGMKTFGQQLFSSGQIRINEISQILQHLSPNVDTIIAGDFNEDDQGGAINKIRLLGFCDALLANKRTHTWEKGLGFLKLAKRCDRIFYSGYLSAQRIQVLHEGSSNHFPVIVDFVFHKKVKVRTKHYQHRASNAHARHISAV